MHKFTFQREGRAAAVIPLDIAGQTFELPVTLMTMRKIKHWGVELEQAGRAVDATPEGLAAAWDTVSGALEDLLGEGAAARIFEGRAPTVEDAADVFRFICEAVRAAGGEPEPASPAPPAPDLRAALRALQDPEVLRAIQKAMA